MIVQFPDHDGQLQLLVMQWKGYDDHAVVGLNMPACISVCAKGLSFSAHDSSLSLDVHISSCSIRIHEAVSTIL
jgi:hypothetical protein